MEPASRRFRGAINRSGIPMTDIQHINQLHNRLSAYIADQKSVLVAFSGGVDSALVLAVAARELGPRCVAFTALSESLSQAEFNDAQRFARELNVYHHYVSSNELSIEGYRANSPNRCYFCKTELYSLAAKAKTELGLDAILDGCNLDDLSDHRPGRKAAAEHHVISPLAVCGLTKANVRAISRHLGLSTAEKPAFACLASRIPHGTEVTPERLRQVEECENTLRALGFRQFRARHHDTTVRLELAEEELERAWKPDIRRLIVAGCKRAGFRYVTLDLEGYRQGSLNPDVAAPAQPGTAALSAHAASVNYTQKTS